jgi:hypothetical protein
VNVYEDKRPDWPCTIKLSAHDVGGGWHWMAQCGGGDGFLGTGDSPSEALRDLAREFERWSLECSLPALITEAARRGK